MPRDFFETAREIVEQGSSASRSCPVASSQGLADAVSAAASTPAEPYPEDYDDFHEPDEDEWDDCGLMVDGQCTKAGSEECDWICGRLG
jgi:hypothetical protein